MAGHICLTFDFDAISVWIQKNMLTMTSVSRGEYGAVVIPRILHMLKQRGIKSTWFIPGHTMETYGGLCADIVADGHEIGLHGYVHENFNVIEADEERAILDRIFSIAEKIAGVTPRGFRSPSWDLSYRTTGYLLEMGIVYDSSLMGNDFTPYYCRQGDRFSRDEPVIFGPGTNLVEIPVSWSLDDYPHYEYVRLPHTIMNGMNSPSDLYTNWTDDARYMLRDFDDALMTVTLHPQASGRGHRFLALERWLDSMLEQDITFHRMDEVAGLFRKGKKFGVYRPL